MLCEWESGVQDYAIYCSRNKKKKKTLNQWNAIFNDVRGGELVLDFEYKSPVREEVLYSLE